MPSNSTQNYQLSQWSRDDQVKMEDFNADNAKIDAALKAEADARTSADSALSAALALKGNCRIWVTSYVGNGQCGEAHPNRLEFPWKPEIVLISANTGLLLTMFYGARAGMIHASGYSSVPTTWTEQSVEWWANSFSAQMNDLNGHHFVVAFGKL